ncbi:sugar phosphate isomerase/epimerase family protein [Plantactinospora endophytica]|uniref:Myo-inositol catabolism protein IolH n=1 Tax=Plantactinospora endophytica TaxID=673535 RepID=A0ABQ4DZD3_9ACTN|nr:sugar phosphate isomerase/epimerase family protein [Plantactinospora endophytica]GIG87829.1 myo-inositol catabolism protein IolH [Plantactinospora endophytica]
MRIAAFPKGDLEAMVVRRSKTVFDWIEDARTLGVDGLELHTGFLWSDEAGYLAEVADAIAGAGFEMPMMCASPDFTHPDPDTRAREIEAQASYMRTTALLGGPGATCRVLSGQAHPTVPVEQGLDWAAGAINELIPLAAELRITLAVENHYKASTWAYPEFAQRPEVFHALLGRIDERVHFGVQYDPSNALVAGADPVEFLRTVIDRVVTMQASDRFVEPGVDLDDLRSADGTIGYSPALKHGVIGQGLNDYPGIFTVLVEAGYDGWISIEDGVNGIDELRASAVFLREARDRWFGGSTAVRVRNHDAARLAAAGTPSGEGATTA